MDVIVKREPFYAYSKAVYDLCIHNRNITGNMASHSISNIWYLLRKTHTDEQRRILLLSICQLFSIADLNQEKLISALERERFSDFEDCLQDECAKELFCDYIVTRNISDYSKSVVKAVTPEDFVKSYECLFHPRERWGSMHG